MKRAAKASNPPADDSTRIISGHATLPEWRRIQLGRQLPEPRFPAGIGVPSVVMLVCLLLVGAATITYFGRPVRRAVPHAAVESQRDLVDEIAHRLAVRTTHDQAEVAEAAAADPARPDAFVAATAAAHPQWLSVAVWNPTTRALVAAVGESLPPDLLAAYAGTAANAGFVGGDLRGRIVHFARRPDGSVLVAAVPVTVRDLTLDPQASQSVLLVLGGKTVIYSQGSPIADADPVRAVIVRAVAAHATHVSTGTTVVRADGVSRVPVVAAAPVNGTDYAVSSVVYLHRTGAGRSLAGMIFGGVLLLIALAGFAAVRLAFVRPVRRLLADAKEVACGAVGGGSRKSRLRETQRLGVALGRLSPRRTPSHRRRRRLQVGAGPVVGAMSVLAIAWSLGLMTFVHARVSLPAQVVVDYQNHADDAAGALRDQIDSGLAALRRTAAALAAGSDRGPALADLAANAHFRSVYILRGTALDGRAGKAPRPHGRWDATAAGVLVDPTDDTVPLVIAHAPLGDRELVAEYDVHSLRSVLNRVHGEVHVVDRRMRTVLDTGGYIPFRRASDPSVRAVAGAAVDPMAAPVAASPRRIVVASLVGVGGEFADDGAAAAAPDPSAPAVMITPDADGGTGGTAPPATDADAAATLGWVVVVTRDASDLDLPATSQMHIAWLIMVLVVTVAAIGWAWQHVMFVRPLRALVRAAENAVRGDRRAHITAERFDEVGALAICLEICRQAAVHGAERLAGAARVRGEGGDYTVVMPRIEA